MFVFSTVLAITAVISIATAIDGNNTDDDNDAERKRSEKQRGMKRGAKKGSKQTENKKTRQDWYEICALYNTKEYKHMTQAAFLRSDATGPLFQGGRSEATWIINTKDD